MKPNHPSNNLPLKPYEQLYGKNLSQEQQAEIKFNLVGYLKTLIEMDVQHREWSKEKEQRRLHINDNE